jgi:hypothetical protein
VAVFAETAVVVEVLAGGVRTVSGGDPVTLVVGDVAALPQPAAAGSRPRARASRSCRPLRRPRLRHLMAG